MKTLVFREDNGGCGNYRVNLIYNHLQNTYKRDNFIVMGKKDNFAVLGSVPFLNSLDNIVFQRAFSSEETKILQTLIKVRKENNLKFKLIYEADDEITSSPIYNHACIISNIKTPVENLQYFDKYILSTDYMKTMFTKKYKIYAKKIFLFKNYVFKDYMYSNINFEPREQFEGRRKRVLMAGSSTHFSRTKKLNGDYLDNVIELLHFIINSDEYELCLIGTVPYFLHDYFNKKELDYNVIFDVFDESQGITVKDEYSESLKVFKWTNFNDYFDLLRNIDPDFLVASLLDNDFNKCKSWIKQIEAYSLPKTVFIGNVFENSPYIRQAHGLTFTEESENLQNLLTLDYDTFYDCVGSQKAFLKEEKMFFNDRIEEYYKILEK